MAYPFAPARREIFKKTFLCEVVLNLSFAPVDDDKFTNGVAAYVSEGFNKKIDTAVLNEAVSLFSDDKQLRLLFKRDECSVSIRYPNYKNFDQAVQWLPVLHKYISAIGSEGLLKAKITKFNELKFKISGDQALNISNAMHTVFSKDLLDPFDIDTDAVRWEKEQDFADEATNSNIHLTFGYKKEAKEDKTGSIVLKSSITKDGFDPKVDFEEELRLLNDLLDGAFQWCVNDSILNNMRQE